MGYLQPSLLAFPHVPLWVLGLVPPLDTSSNSFHWLYAVLSCAPGSWFRHYDKAEAGAFQLCAAASQSPGLYQPPAAFRLNPPPLLGPLPPTGAIPRVISSSKPKVTLVKLFFFFGSLSHSSETHPEALGWLRLLLGGKGGFNWKKISCLWWRLPFLYPGLWS